MELTSILDKAKNEMSLTTGLKPVAVTRAYHDKDGWHLRVAMLEMKRIPESGDLLGDYDVLLDDEGKLVKFERKRTRLRSDRVEEDET